MSDDTKTHLDEWLSPTALAAMLGVPVATVYRWSYIGTGPAKTVVGRHVRFRHSAVEAWLAANTVPPRAAS